MSKELHYKETRDSQAWNANSSSEQKSSELTILLQMQRSELLGNAQTKGLNAHVPNRLCLIKVRKVSALEASTEALLAGTRHY